MLISQVAHLGWLKPFDTNEVEGGRCFGSDVPAEHATYLIFVFRHGRCIGMMGANEEELAKKKIALMERGCSWRIQKKNWNVTHGREYRLHPSSIARFHRDDLKPSESGTYWW